MHGLASGGARDTVRLAVAATVASGHVTCAHSTGASRSRAKPLPRGPGAAHRPPPRPRSPPACPPTCCADLLSRRPDLFQAGQNLVAADRTLDAARAAMMPDIALAGSAGMVLSTALANPIGVFSPGGGISGPPFDGGRLRAPSDTAAARRDQAFGGGWTRTPPPASTFG